MANILTDTPVHNAGAATFALFSHMLLVVIAKVAMVFVRSSKEGDLRVVPIKWYRKIPVWGIGLSFECEPLLALSDELVVTPLPLPVNYFFSSPHKKILERPEEVH